MIGFGMCGICLVGRIEGFGKFRELLVGLFL